MSSFPHRAKKYGESLRKTGTTSKFGDVGRQIDRESEKPKLPEYRFAKQTIPSEELKGKKAESLRDELKELASDEEKPTDSKDFIKKEQPITVRQAPVMTEDDLIERHKIGGAFAKTWTIVDHIFVPPVIKPKKSTFIPNFIMASIIIDGMEECLDGNEELKWISPNYFSLAVRVYYAVIFYIQILKAKEGASKLGKAEGTWFRAFQRVYPLESLPIVGPMVPYLTNIVSVKPNDDRYDFIYPTFETNFGLSVKKGTPSVDDVYFLQPNVLMAAEFLRKFTTMTQANLNEANANGQPRYFDDSGAFVPNRIGETFNFAGIEYPSPLTVAAAQTLANPILDKPLPESKHRISQILSYWRRSKATSIPQANADNAYDNIGESMRLVDDFEWFESCIEMATTQCKFFSDSINMSQIPSTGGSEVLVCAHTTGANKNFITPEYWYPKNWKQLKSQFRTTRADTTEAQFSNAEFALTNATISWESNGHPIGGRQLGHRTGPYWMNREFEFELDHDVEVGRRVMTMIISQFYDSHGNATQ